MSWNLISVPLQQSDMRPPAVFGDDFGGTYYSVAQYGAGGYSVPDTMRLGKGYWLFAGSPSHIDAIGSPQLHVTVSLGQSWNIIGDPFPVPIPLSSVRIGDGIETRTIAEAAGAGWIVGTLYGYNGSSYSSAGQSLNVWRGYWLFALVNGLSAIFDISPPDMPGGKRHGPMVQKGSNQRRGF
jgi:hypothetical protein